MPASSGLAILQGSENFPVCLPPEIQKRKLNKKREYLHQDEM